MQYKLVLVKHISLEATALKQVIQVLILTPNLWGKRLPELIDALAEGVPGIYGSGWFSSGNPGNDYILEVGKPVGRARASGAAPDPAMRIAVDAMGGDFAPQAIVEGAVLAVRADKDIEKIFLVGDETRVRAELERCGAADEPRIEVKAYYGLAVDFAKAENAGFIVKGVRSVKDFEYEREQADEQEALPKRPVDVAETD